MKRDSYTSKGYNAFSPWNESGYEKCLSQMNLGHSAVALMDVINLGVLSNFSNAEFYFGPTCDKRYHYEKQPQFTEEVASNALASVDAALSRLKGPLFSLPPHQGRLVFESFEFG